MTASASHRILLFDHTAALGGGEIALLLLAQELRHHPFDIRILLGSDGPLVPKLISAGFTPVILPMDRAVVDTRKDSLGAGSLLKIKQITAAMSYARRLAKYLRAEKIDLLHTNSLKSDIIGGAGGRLARVPVLWHVRDRICREYLPGSVVKVFRMLSRILPNAVVVNSAATLATLPKRKNAFVAHDGVGELPPLLSLLPSPLNTPPVIGLIGRISPWKGQHIFLRAAAQVLQKFPPARFQIIGAPLFAEADYDREIHALVDSLGIAPAVEFTGFRADVMAAIAALDIVVHASTIGEPFGQVIIEAMSAAKPVIATNGGGVPEIVLPDETGLLVPMADADAMAQAILQFLNDPAAAQCMATAGRARVAAHFMAKHTAEKIAAIYRGILKLEWNNSEGEPTSGVALQRR